MPVAVEQFQNLNEQQRSAVTCPLGPTLVLAGPGSGKTRVLTNRIVHLIRNCDVDPGSILAVTFTNKAAREMMSRLEKMLGPRAAGVTLGTFHSVCARILRRESERFGVGRDFAIFDQDDQTRLMKNVLKELNADEKRYRPGAVLGAVSRAKSEMLTPTVYQPPTYWHEMVGRAYELYQRRLSENNAMDFDDLLLATVWGLQANEAVLRRYRERYRHVLVDEFQDTNLPQFELVRLLGSAHGCVFAVGDEDQSIYGWRGADYRNLQRLRDEFPGLRTYLLERNYRSTQTILDAAKGIIGQNLQRTPKDLTAAQGAGEPVRVREAYSQDDEAEFVVSEIESLVSSGDHRLSDFAVMYRVNAQSRALEEAFMRRRLPYRLVGGTRFYARREVKEILAYLRLISSANEWVSFDRVINVPPRGIGDKTLSLLHDLGARMSAGPYDVLTGVRDDERRAGEFSRRAVTALLAFLDVWESLRHLSEETTVAELIDAILALFGYAGHLASSGPEGEERLENVHELRTVAAEHFPTPGRMSLIHFLDEVALVADSDDLEEVADAPVLMTLHTAKGLEFPVVFIVGMQEGLLPHSRSLDEPRQLEEERRLCYVGVTRAMKRLYLLHSLSGGLYGDTGRSIPSRFLDDLPPGVVAADRAKPASAEARPTTRCPWRPTGATTTAGTPVPQSPVFKIGETVRHAHFGEGTVVECKPIRGDVEVNVSFGKRGIKRLLLSLANLEQV